MSVNPAQPQMPPVQQSQPTQQQQAQQAQQQALQPQQSTDRIAKLMQEVFMALGELATAYGTVDVVALVENVEGGKDLVNALRKLMKSFKELQEEMSRMVGQVASSQ